MTQVEPSRHRRQTPNALNLISIAEQTCLTMSSSPNPDGGEKPDDNPYADFVAEWKTAIDPEGRRSMSLRSTTTGEQICFTRMINDGMVDQTRSAQHRKAAWRAFRGLDKTMCWFMFEGVRPGVLRSGLQILCFPFALLRLAFVHLRSSWEFWRAS